MSTRHTSNEIGSLEREGSIAWVLQVIKIKIKNENYPGSWVDSYLG